MVNNEMDKPIKKVIEKFDDSLTRIETLSLRFADSLSRISHESAINKGIFERAISEYGMDDALSTIEKATCGLDKLADKFETLQSQVDLIEQWVHSCWLANSS